MADALKQTIFFFSFIWSHLLCNRKQQLLYIYSLCVFCLLVSHYSDIIYTKKKNNNKKKNYPKGMENIHICNTVTVYSL